jgi:choline-sulfatase
MVAIRFLIALLALANAALGQTPVILVSIDTLRADHVGVYGYRKTPTPEIDSFAGHGTVFTAIESHIPLTLPSHASLLTSRYPFSSWIEENGERVPDGAVTLASVLQARGYKTGAFIGSVILNRSCGLNQGFDFYDSPFHVEGGQATNPYQMHVRRDSSLVIRAASQWLDANRGQPVFAFVHLFDLHTPYALGSYDAEIAHVDQALGRFKQALMRGGWWDRSLVVLLADHGESLGEHGEDTHGYFIYESTLHVPLIIHWPAAGAGHPQRIAEPAGLVDVAPTILDFLGVPAPPSFQGKSLLQPGERAIPSESLYTQDAFHWAALRGVRLGAYKFIEAPRAELYNLRDDPGEQNNLLRKDTAKALELRGRLNLLLSRFATEGPQPAAAPGADAMLKSLGYLGSAPGAAIANNGPDPKDRLEEYRHYEKALSDLYAQRFQAAIGSFRQLLALDSRNTLARYYLGEAYLGARQPDAALREWETALAGEHDYTPAAEASGELWLARQQYAKAAPYFEHILARTPNDYSAHFNLGLAQEHLGDRKGALEHLRAACKIAPDFAECRRELNALETPSQ